MVVVVVEVVRDPFQVLVLILEVTFLDDKGGGRRKVVVVWRWNEEVVL